MIRALAIALVLACAAVAVQSARLHRAQLALAESKTATAVAAATAEREARAVEWDWLRAIFDAGTAYERGKLDAQAAADRVVADLRSGALRLRREWAGCETQRLAEAAATAAELDAAELRRAESAGRIVRAAAECDAQVAGLQAIVRAYTAEKSP